MSKTKKVSRGTRKTSPSSESPRLAGGCSGCEGSPERDAIHAEYRRSMPRNGFSRKAGSPHSSVMTPAATAVNSPRSFARAVQASKNASPTPRSASKTPHLPVALMTWGRSIKRSRSAAASLCQGSGSEAVGRSPSVSRVRRRTASAIPASRRLHTSGRLSRQRASRTSAACGDVCDSRPRASPSNI